MGGISHRSASACAHTHTQLRLHPEVNLHHAPLSLEFSHYLQTCNSFTPSLTPYRSLPANTQHLPPETCLPRLPRDRPPRHPTTFPRRLIHPPNTTTQLTHQPDPPRTRQSTSTQGTSTLYTPSTNNSTVSTSGLPGSWTTNNFLLLQRYSHRPSLTVNRFYTHPLSIVHLLSSKPLFMSQLLPDMDKQYLEFRHQIQDQPPMLPTSHQGPHRIDNNTDEDVDIDAQLENISPERGGSSLQVSLERQSMKAVQEVSQKSIRIVDSTPPTLQYRNPRTGDASESQSTKRRKVDDFTATSIPHGSSKHTTPSHHIPSNRTLGIDMLSHT